MAKIENTTLKQECQRIADIYISQGRNWDATAGATAIVRTVLKELGLTAELGDEYKDERKSLVGIITPLLTASKNFHSTYLNDTLREDGKTPVMAYMATEKKVLAEFA